MPPSSSRTSGTAPPDKLLALHQQRLRQILGVLVLAFCVLALMNFGKGRPVHASVHLTLVGVLLLACWMNECRRMERAVRMLVATLMLGLFVLTAGDQGLFDEAPMAYPALLVFAGMFGSKRLLLVLVGLMVLSLALLFGLDRAGLLHSVAAPLGPPRLVTMSMIVLISGFFVWMLASDLRETLQQLDSEKQALLESHERIQVLAQRDSLTGLPNRALALDRLERMLDRARRDQRLAAVIFLDLDDFKTVNDSLGHAAGDGLLRQVAQRLRACVRESDTVARVSGDEFLILLGDLDDELAITAVVAQVMQSLEPVFSLEGMDVVATASIGVAVAPRDGHETHELLKNADLAMYRAKDSGRNTCRFFDASMNESVVEQLRIASGLRTALARGELQVHYQPQFDLPGGRVVGAEALLRWQHAELGLIPPDKFIPVAERSGLITELGAWVLARACEDAQAWRRQGLGELTVAVNVSSLQFHRETIERDIAHALSASGLPAAALELELTESLLMADARHLHDALRRIAGTGVRITVDDFGTGYSNLGYLRRFALHRLKIDQTFVQKLCDGPVDEGLVRAIIDMAHCLGLAVVGEGIEDGDTLRRLQAIGCEFGQGFHWSPALPQDTFMAFVRGRQAGGH